MPDPIPSQPPVVCPWPLGLPLLRAIRHDPLHMMEQLHATHGDVAHLKILSTHLFYLFRPEAVRQVLVDHQADFVKEQRILDIFQTVHGANVIATEGAVWERQRRILASAFSLRRIEACASLMAAAADDGIRVDLPAGAGQSALIDVDRLTTRITMDVILRALFSYHGNREESDTVSRAVRGLSRQVMREFFWPLQPVRGLPYPGRAQKARNLEILHRLIASHIDARRSGEDAGSGVATDMLELLLVARDEQSSAQAALTDQEVHDNCIGLFGAGHDTSASALAWWVGLMAAHPDVATRVRDELDAQQEDALASRDIMAKLPLLQATLKEAMRLYPPSTSTFSRSALRDVQIDGLNIPRHALIVIPIWSLHRDARWFPEPNAFRPERFLPDAPAIPRGAFMPFSAGPHFCLGQQFAMVEMTLIASRLIRHFDLSLEEGSALPAPEVDLVLKPSTRLNVWFKRR